MVSGRHSRLCFLSMLVILSPYGRAQSAGIDQIIASEASAATTLVTLQSSTPTAAPTSLSTGFVKSTKSGRSRSSVATSTSVSVASAATMPASTMTIDMASTTGDGGGLAGLSDSLLTTATASSATTGSGTLVTTGLLTAPPSYATSVLATATANAYGGGASVLGMSDGASSTTSTGKTSVPLQASDSNDSISLQAISWLLWIAAGLSIIVI